MKKMITIQIKTGLDLISNINSKRKERSTGQVRDFKVYEADEFQATPELEQLAKTKSGRQRQVRYNPNWQYLKEKAKEALQSPTGRHIYGMKKYDVEPVFGHLKRRPFVQPKDFQKAQRLRFLDQLSGRY